MIKFLFAVVAVLVAWILVSVFLVVFFVFVPLPRLIADAVATDPYSASNISRGVISASVLILTVIVSRKIHGLILAKLNL